MVLKPHVEQEQEHEMIREQLYRWEGRERDRGVKAQTCGGEEGEGSTAIN